MIIYCSQCYEIKRCLLLGRKAMTNLDHIFKSRDITLLTKVHIIKAMVFPVVMYGWESWIIKKAECQRIVAFELWCWRRLLRIPWIARRSNQSILKEINPEYSLKGLLLKLKLQYFCHLMQRADSLEKTLMLGKIEGNRRRGWQKIEMVRQYPHTNVAFDLLTMDQTDTTILNHVHPTKLTFKEFPVVHMEHPFATIGSFWQG